VAGSLAAATETVSVEPMILYLLRCAKRHEFEAWFRDSSGYEALAAKRAVACPECGNSEIDKAPMAPSLGRGRHPAAAAEAPPPNAPAPDSAERTGSPARPALTSVMAREARAAIEALRKKVEESCDDVGERFAEEARKIHYGETAAHDIYGETSDEDAAALADEGIEFHRIPWIRRRES
jgi:hypothetical protein